MKSNRKFLSELYGKLIYPCGRVVNLGLLSTKYITDAYAKYYIDCLQGLEAGIANFKYHDTGTGTTAENVDDTALETPTGMARVTGSQIEGITAKVYQSAALFTYDGTYEITEWGILNASSSGTLMDRAVMTAISVALNYQVEYTYNHTALSGG